MSGIVPNKTGQQTMENSEPVVIASDQSALPVSGTVTVDTSLLATAANQATEIASLSVLDDWDETDRAKVNLIVGQAGIAAGTGVDGATVPRVTLATNVALPAGTNNIGDVDVVSSALPTGASTLAEQQTQTTALQLIDDTVATDGAATPTKGILIAGQDGTNAQTIKTDTDGNLQVDVLTMPSTTVTATDLDIRDLVFATDKVDASGSVLGAGTNNIGDVDIVSGTITTVSTVTSLTQMNGAAISMNTGVRDAGTQRVTIATNDVVPVSDNGGSITVDAPTGTPVNTQIGNGTLQAGIVDETGASAVDALSVGGGTPHDSVDSGNPVKIGGVAVSGSATPTSVASGDRVRSIFNQHGIQYTMGGHPNLICREYDFGTAAQTDVNLAAAAVAADERIYVTRFEALCDNANTVAVSVRAGFGTASVPSASATGVSGMIASHPGIAAGSGIICGNGAGILAVGGAGEEPRLTSSAATTGNLHVIIAYYLIDETP